MLTHRQRQVWDIIAEFNARNLGPSYQEIAARLVPPLASRSGVHRLVEEMLLRGVVRKMPNSNVRRLVAVNPRQIVSPTMAEVGSRMLRLEFGDEWLANRDALQIATAVYEAMNNATPAPEIGG